jgi:hypothetical protein
MRAVYWRRARIRGLLIAVLLRMKRLRGVDDFYDRSPRDDD